MLLCSAALNQISPGEKLSGTHFVLRTYEYSIFNFSFFFFSINHSFLSLFISFLRFCSLCLVYFFSSFFLLSIFLLSSSHCRFLSSFLSGSTLFHVSFRLFLALDTSSTSGNKEHYRIIVGHHFFSRHLVISDFETNFAQDHTPHTVRIA